MKILYLIIFICFLSLISGCASIGPKYSKKILERESPESFGEFYTPPKLEPRGENNFHFFPDDNIRALTSLHSTRGRKDDESYTAANVFVTDDAEQFMTAFDDYRATGLRKKRKSPCCNNNILQIDKQLSGQVTLAINGAGKNDVQKDAFAEFEDTQLDSRESAAFDPLIGYNRFMFQFNDKMYFWIMKPVARGYGKVVPEKGRIAINRFFKNLGFPIRFVNNVLQGKFKYAGVETLRFLVNSTVGILGFFDPASIRLNLQAHEEDFGQTLGRYGAGEGFPVVLPFLGPSNLRDIFGMIPDFFLNPVAYIGSDSDKLFNKTFVLITAGELINRTSLNIGIYENLKQDALDPYIFMRDAYKQNRNSKIQE